MHLHGIVRVENTGCRASRLVTLKSRRVNGIEVVPKINEQ